MARYRPPRRRGTPLITPAGEAALRAELVRLWKEERPQVTQAVHEAAKNGDRSENGDYIYGKRRLREIDSRVRFLNKRLEEVTVVDQPPADTGKVYFGAWVTLEDEAGEESTWRIVGPDEFDLARRAISIDAPMARALLGRRIDEDVIVQAPGGRQRYRVTSIRYGDVDVS
ncbi:MAG: transcription elongation factor GreB [Pseudohaliea sp.]